MKIFLFIIVFCCTLTVVAQNAINNSGHSFIHFHEYGKGEALIILGGGPGNDCHQEEDITLKTSSLFHSILLEQRGTGKSMPSVLDANSINLDLAISDIVWLMDSLNIDKAIFYGHSWGALLATFFAVKYPGKVKSLIFVGPGQCQWTQKAGTRFLKTG
ncbi:MAG: alpha/beta hydrolase [Agriterribacter sp.]